MNALPRVGKAKARMHDIETGNRVWSADTTGWIRGIVVTSNGSIYASGTYPNRLLKIDPETGDITELFPIEDIQSQIVQYRLWFRFWTVHPD